MLKMKQISETYDMRVFTDADQLNGWLIPSAAKLMLYLIWILVIIICHILFNLLWAITIIILPP